MTTIATTEPTQFTAGDTVKWKIENSDYPADNGWVLTYAFRSAERSFDVTSSATGADHSVTITPTTSATFTTDTDTDYVWQSYMTKAEERYQVDSGSLKVKYNLAGSTAFDGRTHTKKVLNALESLLEGKATKDQQSYSIGNRSLSRMSPAELLEWRSYYMNLYNSEVQAEAINNGLGHKGRILVRL